MPQGLALDGDTAWVSGYRWRQAYGDRPCRLMRVDLRTGKVLASTTRLTGSVGDRRSTFCRHGGALSLDRHGLWLAEADRLWLVDPARVGRQDQVLRVWRTVRPVRGSALLDGSRSELGLASFADRRAGVTRTFAYRDLLAPGVTTLVPTAVAGPVVGRPGADVVRDPPGAGDDPRPRWCLVDLVDLDLRPARHAGRPPGRVRARGRGPGVRRHGHVWAVLESGARHYQEAGRPLVPMLARFDVDALLAGPDETCTW